MLESLAAWLLNTYIGDYFGNVNTEQLRMSVRSGEIELERLPLKRDLLKHLGLPLEASTGYIGKISIKFPRWHLFTSEPLVITVDELYLLVKPITDFAYNEEEENRAQQEFKMSQLDMLEQRWKALHEDLTEQSSYYSSSYSSWLNYGSSFFSNILLNVHLKVSSVHIRYEDSSTIPGCPFATGCVIRSLSVCSTDEHWEPKYVTRDNLTDRNLLFKMIELESFSVYFDTDTSIYTPPSRNRGTLDRSQLQNLVDLMRDNLEHNRTRSGDLSEHSYIIAPVNGKCYLKRNSSEMSLKSCKQPRTVIDVQLEQVPIMMTAVQYKHLLDWSLAFQTSKTLWRYRKWRPMISRKRALMKSRTISRCTEAGEEEEEEELYLDTAEELPEPTSLDGRQCRVGFDPKTWWHFAVNANLEEYRQRRQRFNWHFILQRSRDLVAYHKAYIHYLLFPEMYSKEMRYVKDRVESELSLDELCSIREIVFNEADDYLKNQNLSLPARSQVPPVEEQIPQQPATESTSSWFLPYSLISNLYYNYSVPNPEVDPESALPEIPVIPEPTPGKRSHRRTQSTSSTASLATDDIFLLRDAIFCQFNFQIRNSSFQLIAFNSDETANSGNLLLEFEFTQMKIAVDITNPNAYACVCHMNQGYRRRQATGQNTTSTSQQIAKMANLTSPQKFLTQNELNMLQFNLNFECRNLDLTLLRTDHAIISSVDAQKLATASLTGCGLMFVFSQSFISIDGRLDSLEILDLVTEPTVNKHKRVLSIGAKQLKDPSFELEDGQEMTFTEVSTNGAPPSLEAGAYRSLPSLGGELEKAFSFSLSRQFAENTLRLNIEMASFSYVHSAVLVQEISLCRECFSDVLEAYFSRSFKERVKAATTEMLRGIVKSSATSADESKDSSTMMSFKTTPESIAATRSKLVLGSKARNRKAKSQQISPFVDNFKLNIFIRSPVIIFPISPSSYEVVVFHLGHMLLNNHNHSSEFLGPKSGHPGGLSPGAQNNTSGSSANSSSAPTSTDSYNAEIRDLSVYSLDCSRNIAQYGEVLGNNAVLTESQIPLFDVYYCDTFGVPILQKTVIEIVLEKKVLMSQLMEGSMSQKRSLSSRLSMTPAAQQAPPIPAPMVPQPTSGKTSTSSMASSQEDSVLIDGLNIISTVNSIDSFRPPKKFSIRSHIYPDAPLGGEFAQPKEYKGSPPKPELVLSVEVSSIDVRFSYNDLLVFLHIVNTLMPEKGTGGSKNEAGSMVHSGSSPKEENDESALNMEELEEMFSAEFRRRSRKSIELRKSQSTEEMRSQAAEEMPEVRLSELDPTEFKLRLDKLQDLGFEYGESLRALALTGGDVIEAAFMLSSAEKKPDLGAGDGQVVNSSDDNVSQCTFSTERSASYQNLHGTSANSTATNLSTTGRPGSSDATAGRRKGSGKGSRSNSSSSSLLSSLAVIEVRILAGSIRIIDDCNQLDIPLLELGIKDALLWQQNGSPVIEAHAESHFYCDYYNSHLSGWEPVVEHCQVSLSWKIHTQRCQLKSMLNQTTSGAAGTAYKAPRRKLALKIDIKKMFNLNVSRTMIDLVEKVRTVWVQDITNWVALPPAKRCFRKRSPFIPFALKNETGSELQLLLPSSSAKSVLFSTGKAPDLVTHCDLRSSIEATSGQAVCFDILDTRRESGSCSATGSPSQKQRWSLSGKAHSASGAPQKITVKVDGWSVTFPVSIEREGTFIRHIVSERYFNQSAVLVFEITLQPSAVKLITVRSSLQVANRTTKNVELNFANTAMSDVKTSYIIAPSGLFPVPLKLLYARMQLRPCDLGLGACRTPINWSHVRKYGEQHCSLQICTPITHTSQASYSASAPYVVTVLVERNSIGALIESRKVAPGAIPANVSSAAIPTTTSTATLMGGSSVYGQAPLVTIPSHTITLLPPLQLANRLPTELKFTITNTTTSGTIKSGEDYSVHYVSPLEPFTLEFCMEHFPKSKPLTITPGATKDYSSQVDMYDYRGRLLVLHVTVTVVAGSGAQPCNAMTITVYSPYWIINRSGLPLIFAQEGVYTESAGQSVEHERARSICPLLYSHADGEAPKYAIMRLGKMTEGVEPRWCNFFVLEKGTFYRRLRVTESMGPTAALQSFDPMTGSPGKAHAHYFPPATEKIYEFGIDIRTGRDRYSQTKIVTIAPRFQIENLTSYKLEFAQKCIVDTFGGPTASGGSGGGVHPQSLVNGGGGDFYPPSSPARTGSFTRGGSFSLGHYHRSSNGSLGGTPVTANMSMSSATSVISALPKSNMPFHWPETDQPKLLCVRIASFLGCLWSGSFSVGTEPSVSFHLNIRDDSGRSYFIRVEILLQNATYFIVFTDANSLPPPIRVENFSQVPIEFYQAGTTSLLARTRVRPNSSVPYALDEPSLASHLTVCAPGGAFSTYDLNSFAPGDNLTYDNFYYLAFEETFVQASGFGLATPGIGATGGSYIADLDDDEQLMLMMLAGPDLVGLGPDSETHSGNVGSQMLVLDVPDESDSLNTESGGATKPVVMTRKERGKRSQLWRIDLQNRIIHEGSCPPLEPGIADLGFADVHFGGASYVSPPGTMVLDVADEGGASYDGSSLPLVIRRLSRARERTQTWKFTGDGRLRCAKYEHLFVAPMGRPELGSALFRSGTPACLVLGPAEEGNDGRLTPTAKLPRTQAIMKQKMRKGSGILNVSIQADGPSRVLRIKDQQMSANGRHLHLIQHYNYGSPITLGQFGIERSAEPNSAESFLVKLLRQTELELHLDMDSIGISVINRRNEELVYLFMTKIQLETILNPTECRLHAVVQNFQVDNQLRHCEKEVVLYVENLSESAASSPDGSVTSQALVPYSGGGAMPSITFIAHKLFIPNVETNVFKSLQVSINDLVVNIEKLLLLKFLEFLQYDPVDSEMDEISAQGSGAADALYHANRNVSSSLARSAQYYFAFLLIQLSTIKLSVFTSAQRVSSYLSELKKKAGIKLIRFEDALIHLRPFHKVYSLMTRRFLQDSIKEHYRAELRSQAAKILGTVDFLGNPVGFLNDMADGFSDLIGGNLSGLIMNVTHGISDSTAKFTSVLSESLGSVTMDTRYQEIRRKIKQESSAGGQRGHLSAGALGLAHGLIGGITSVITQTYDGVVTQGGVTGLLSGFGKGVLGTFTKPAVGMLDFASSAATAVRDSSRKSGHPTSASGRPVKRVRLPRTLTIDGRLTTYDAVQATWQARFYGSNDFGTREYGEQFVAVFLLADRHFLLLTTERLFFFHSTLRQADLPSASTSDFLLEEQLDFEETYGRRIGGCSILQLQVLALEQFTEAVHYQMLSGDAQRFLRLNGAQTSCLDFGRLKVEDICHFVELRTVTPASKYAAYANGGGSSPSSPRTSSASSSGPLRTVTGVDFPKLLNLCYVYVEEEETVVKLIQLVNEAKHLQEERKFEVATTPIAAK